MAMTEKSQELINRGILYEQATGYCAGKSRLHIKNLTKYVGMTITSEKSKYF
jgi:hypothetical protein